MTSRYGHLLAPAAIMAVMVAGWLAMPRLMLAVAGGGPVVGVLIAVAFMLFFFAIFWLRTRYQRRLGG